MAEIKTKPTTSSVEEFINSVSDENKRKDSLIILNLMKEASGEEPKMWGGLRLLGLGTNDIKAPKQAEK